MSTLRLKGQEVTVLITRGGQLEDTITDISSLDIEVELELKESGFLGKKTEEKDEIFKGVKFDMELNIHSGAWFDFVSAIVARAKREIINLVVNITAVCAFPSGETREILLADVNFGAIPHNISSRGDYVKPKMTGKCSDWQQNAA